MWCKIWGSGLLNESVLRRAGPNIFVPSLYSTLREHTRDRDSPGRLQRTEVRVLVRPSTSITVILSLNVLIYWPLSLQCGEK
jgi:hypothetical protein